MPPDIPPPSSDLSTFKATIGAWSIGANVSTALLGITTLQCWIYHTRFPKDPLIIKLLTVFIWCFETLRTALCVHAGYYYSVEHWGNISITYSTVPYWGLQMMIVLTAPVALLTHLFFAHQIRCITSGKHPWLFYVIVLLSFGDFAFALATCILAILAGNFGRILLGLPSHIATIGLACDIAVDWTITISLVLFLRNNQGARTRSLMQTLIVYSINFGLLISLTDLVVLILSNVRWANLNLYQVSIFEVVGNFYANSVLASLNSRTLVAAHLHRPGNLHFSSINAASTQIHGFNQPAVRSLDESIYQISPMVHSVDGGMYRSNSIVSVDTASFSGKERTESEGV